jgi:hypothetical protein
MRKISTSRLSSVPPVWAVRIGEFVELRQGTELIKKTSKLKRKMKREQTLYGMPYYPPRYENAEVVLTQIAYLGGEVLGYIKLRSFQRIFRFTPAKNDAVKLDKHQRSIVLRADWRRRNFK